MSIGYADGNLDRNTGTNVYKYSDGNSHSYVNARRVECDLRR